MIAEPSCAQLLESVRDTLRSKIQPHVANPEAVTKLVMIDSILASVAVRSEKEVAWIREEIAMIEHGAELVIAAGDDKAGGVAVALNELRQTRKESDYLSDLRGEYRLAGELLSCTIEAAMPAGGELRKAVVNILATRLAHEVEIKGKFSLAGRE